MYLVYFVIILFINAASSFDLKDSSSFDLKDASSFDLKDASSFDLKEAPSFDLKEASTLSSLDLNMTLRGIPQDGALDFRDLSAKYNHPAGEHFIITEDGYNLTMFHIPGDKERPVLLAHGIFDTSDGWILRGNHSLVYMLAEEGYDVWIMNQRGNRYARRHVKLDPERPEFWDFSVHELAIYDLPACIDYVLKRTGQAQLSLIGFSEGTSMGYVLAATRPEYNKKIRCFMCLAPVAYLHNTLGQMKLWLIMGGFLDKILPVNEMLGFYSYIKGMVNFICTQLILGYEICYAGVMSNLIGPNLAAINKSFFEAIMGHFPAGTSKKNLVHFAQIGMSETLSYYDYGFAKNMILYGSGKPPLYDLGKVTMDVYLISCRNDRVSTIEDVRQLAGELPNVQEWIVLEDEKCNHLDHLWAEDAHLYEYPRILEFLRKCFKKD